MDFDYRLHIFHSPLFHGVVNDAIAFFTSTPVHMMLLPQQFIGSGVYALYYVGDGDLYARVASLNRDGCVQPIYVGKAVPPGWRTARTKTSESPDIYLRLRKHARSLRQVQLPVEDFRCRFVILSGTEGDLIVPVEAELIRTYRPIWNTIVDGFGNHDPRRGRYDQARSEWDALHPGRPWAARLTGESPRREEIEKKVRQFLESLSP